MDIKNKLNELDLTTDNSIVISSGILNALNLRESKDIDMVVTEQKYKKLTNKNHFKRKQKHGHELLIGDLFEIGTSWIVMGKSWTFEDLLGYSTVIDGVRYNSVEFLLSVKRSWITEGNNAKKHLDDVKLIENYLLDKRKNQTT